MIWQIPISCQHGSNGPMMVHRLEINHRTDVLRRTACGRLVNPGFAEIPPLKTPVRYCSRCKNAKT